MFPAVMRMKEGKPGGSLVSKISTRVEGGGSDDEGDGDGDRDIK